MSRRFPATKALFAAAALVAISAGATNYDFLQVTTNSSFGTFTSINGNGFIIASNSASPNGLLFMNNWLYQSQFPVLFPSSGSITGWLSRAADYAFYTNVFILNNYALKTNTVFGIWNMTEETNQYSIQLLDGAGNQISPPFNWNFIGYDDDSDSGYIGWCHMNLDFNTGIFNPTNYTQFTGNKNDCDGAFWDNLPLNTKKIVFIGHLTTNNHDGVVFYFAEPTPCKITCPGDIVVTICGQGTNVYFPPPILTGQCGTNTPVLLSDGVSGSYFPVGTNVVTWGISGSTNTCSFKITVINSDTNPPVITCPSNIVLFTCGSNVVANYAATATDGTNPTPVIIYSTPSGMPFPPGTNSVSCIAIDACSNTASCSFDVIVKLIPPVWTLTCPNESNFVNVTGCPPVMPVLTNLVTISNSCPIPGGLSITQSPPAGTILSAGPYNVTIWVCATNGACSNCTVIVNGFISSGCCTIACPTNITVTTCGTNSAVATFPTPSLSGPCSSNATVVSTSPSGSSFPPGTNIVNCIATNGAGATVASCSFTVTVVSSAFTNAYDFLRVSIIGAGGKFTSPNGNGFITVTNTGGPFLGLNNTAYPSKFPNLFPASGTVTGWLAQANNNANYTNTFYLTNYARSTSTVFGIWSITEETNTYQIRLLDAANNQIAPTFGWNFLGYDDDSLSGNIGWYHMVLNPSTGFFSTTPFKISGIDSDAAFWDNIPTNTAKIIVTGALGANNADGVVFYFAERRPCPILCRFCLPTISVSLVSTNLILSWRQADYREFRLEETSALAGPLANWSWVTNSPTIFGDEFRVTVPAQHPQRFYRLKEWQGPPGGP